jgi:hypothetical protein
MPRLAADQLQLRLSARVDLGYGFEVSVKVRHQVGRAAVEPFHWL